MVGCSTPLPHVGFCDQLIREMILAIWNLSRLLQKQDMPTGELNLLIADMSREMPEMFRERQEMKTLDRR